jgi:hypothetical protein
MCENVWPSQGLRINRMGIVLEDFDNRVLPLCFGVIEELRISRQSSS